MHAEHLRSVRTTLQDVQAVLLRLLVFALICAELYTLSEGNYADIIHKKGENEKMG